MSKRSILALSVSLFAFEAMAQEPRWLVDARAREGKMGPAEIKSVDNWFKAKVPAKLIRPIEKSNGSYTVELDIGSVQPAYCEIVPDGFDQADMIRRSLDLMLSKLEEVQGKLEGRGLESADAGAWGNVPYLQAQWIYRVNDGKAPRLGGVKQISMQKDDQGIYCMHLDLGYTKSFQAVARAFAETFTSTSPVPTPYYQEIAVAAVNGMKLGVMTATLERDADGDTKAEETTSMLIPGAEGELHSQDAVHQQWIRPDASLINATHFIASDGEFGTSLALKRQDDAWIIEGDLDGKKFSETLKTNVSPGTWVGQAFALRKLLATDKAVGAELSMPQWTAEDPARLTDTKTKVLAKAGDKQFKGLLTAGKMTANVIINKATGMVDVAEMSVGGQQLKIERVYLHGGF
jgi:hypothetical protein